MKYQALYFQCPVDAPDHDYDHRPLQQHQDSHLCFDEFQQDYKKNRGDRLTILAIEDVRILTESN